ncbi:MAG TPA: response regulator transcription factor [Acidimicrobiales bacterium]|nr:response regulator transcription factor [Acidimicrobiales bacterium]
MASPSLAKADHGTVVIVEDDHHIADLVDLWLRNAGFRVLQATEARRGLEFVAKEHPSLVLLDIGLPGPVDGIEVCREIRRTSEVPVVFLTARDDEVDRVLGLELGADDYIVKPFSPRELVARVRAVLRRTEGSHRVRENPLSVGGLTVDTVRREVTTAAGPVRLTAREFDLLVHFAANTRIVFTRRQLLDSVWGPGWIGDERTVDVHVRQLRRKLGEALPLKTIWGVGYRCD